MALTWRPQYVSALVAGLPTLAPCFVLCYSDSDFYEFSLSSSASQMCEGQHYILAREFFFSSDTLKWHGYSNMNLLDNSGFQETDQF